MSEHTKGLLALFRNGQSVGSADGTGVCEVWPRDENGFPDGEGKANARRIVACWNLLHEFDTEAIEAGTFADFIGKQVYQHEIENANSGELRLSDVSLQLMAAGFAGKMKANRAENYMEFGLFHPETGHITLTVQRTEGLTPAQRLAAMTKQRDVLLEALNGVQGVMNNSQGVAGWHQNGAIATWDELLPEVAAALEFAEGEKS
ncbi:hypothetical protein [Aeromonas rivipollensis]|uniref:hypothetical protein n=1 Tax=Aeromonas rivipollensis TaxID=948519 RepID=UPI000D11CE93|nr:hypothetical protein [Aeromonas rivipollensis]AVP94675.1 hypothetical protein C7N77_16850 [Aeromonas rivipollensis]